MTRMGAVIGLCLSGAMSKEFKKMSIHQEHNARLPVTRDLTLAYLASLALALTMLVASSAGLFDRTVIYPPGLSLSFAATDAVNLTVGLPILLGSLWLARRGRLVGLLCWPGALFFALYNYATYIVAVPFNALFLAYLVLVTLSAYTLIGVVTSIDGVAVRRRLVDAVPARAAGGILAGIALLSAVRQIAVMVTALTSQAPVTTLECAQWIADLAVGMPPLLVGGLLLWRREALGYVAGMGMLLVGSMLFIGLIHVMVFQALASAAPIDGVGILIVLVMGAICFIPFALFVRGAILVR